MMSRSRHPENVSPQTQLRAPVCKGTYQQRWGDVATIMHHGNGTMQQCCVGAGANHIPQKLATGGGKQPTFCTACTQRTEHPKA